MSFQPDPRYFRWGTAFQEGVQQSQDNKRRNALLDLEQKQYGLNERRVNAEEARLAQSDAERQAQLQAAQRQESIGLRALAAARGDRQSGVALLQELGLPGNLADDPDAGEMFQSIAQQFGGFELPKSVPQWREATRPGPYGNIIGQENPETGEFKTIQAPTREPVGSSSPKPPSGFRYNANDELEPIPGGPADIKARIQQKKETDAKQKLDSLLDAEIGNIDKIIGSADGRKKPHKGLDALTGFLQSRIPTYLKGQDAQDAESLHNSLKSKASINALREIRSGGSQSIGQITEREWPRLEQMKVALDNAQSREQYVAQLAEYREELMLMKRNAAAALSQGQAPASAPQDDPLGLR